MQDTYATLQDERDALHNRSLRRRFPDGFATLLFLTRGTLLIGEDENERHGPALFFWPGNSRDVLTLKAGASARLLGLSDAIILDAIGARSELVHLRMLVETPFSAVLSEDPKVPQIETLFDWFAHELEEPERRSPMSMSAFLRLLLIAALRVHTPEDTSVSAEATNVLRQFRHLVELHYKDHWKVTRYADTLGVEYDRLHRICKRDTGRSPAELVHERITAEAKARLENSGLPLKKIAADLGFSDASRFSHFFKRRTDLSPGAYRAVVSRPDSDDLQDLRRGFSDWP
ncbi:AraC family transcriptional regulator [Phaeobacter sp. J2-8]|uniref:AraC family transcriptional regulator n=1 Tax=Phaeobacter sp. J2-8 TaxID=2931394 RepID=UPI001FD4F206|nr:AraC family transcriptional regulator [Phaeobacter sp. J2-8]MCJ7872943.1 AraC family transcriptional regulator [Phaeobacter sp. J2-8]